MPSTAISSQGSTLHIGTGSGAAKTISAIAVGNPTIVTSTAHGLGNGDVVALAAFGGANAAALNGLSVVVKNVTANTFAFDVNTVGLTITAGSATATPTQWTKIANWKAFSGLDGQRSEIDTSNLDSTGKEYLLGLADFGQFTSELDYGPADAGQLALRAALSASTSRPFKLTLPNLETVTFNGLVKSLPISGGVDQVVKSQVTIRITGSPTFA